MDSRASSPHLGSLSASEIAAMEYAALERKIMAICAPLIHALAPVAPICRNGDIVPAVACSAVPTTPRGEVAHTTATSADLTTAEASQPLRSVVMRGGSLFISVPAYPEQRQPSDPLSDPLKEIVEQEDQKTVAQTSEKKPGLPSPKKKKPRLPPSEKSKSRPLRSQQQQQTTSQNPSRPARQNSYAEFRQKINKPYPFKRESIQRIFKYLLKRRDFQLPKPIRPNQADRSGEPNYCPYHRTLGHMLEDCVTFKGWLEKGLQEGSVVIPDECLVDSNQKPKKVIFDLTAA